MAFKKFSASQLFTGCQMLGSSHVLITNETGTVEEITQKENAGDDIQFFEGIICPGFVNTHCHLELSHLKGKIPEYTGLVNFVQQVMQQRNATEEEKLTAMQQAEKEMYESGIVAVGDICNTADSIPVKQHSNIYWHNFIEVTGFVPGAATKRLEEVKSVSAQFTIYHPPAGRAGLPFTIVPHAAYSVSPALFGLINGLPGNNLITIHNQETEDENEFFKTKKGGFLNLYKNLGIDISFFEPTGKSSLKSWISHFTIGQKLILVHNVTTNEEDILALRQSAICNPKSEIVLCLCPNANNYISKKLPDIDLLIASGFNIAIGTDSLASNHQLNILEEIKTLHQQCNHLTIEQLLQYATFNSAKALNIENTFGSFENGKQPGVVLIDNTFTTSKRIL